MTFVDYFQIATVATVLLIILLKASYLLLVRRINPIAVASGGKGLSRVIEALAFFGLIVWLIEVLSFALHSRIRILPQTIQYQMFDVLAAKIAGAILVTSGFIVFVLAFFNFGDSWRMGIDRKTPGSLVTTGIFAISRNPIYVFFGLWFIATFLINGTAVFLAFAFLAIAVLHWQILREEKFLTKRHGEAYQRYLERTPRYLFW